MSSEPTLREVPRVQRELAERIVGGAFPPGVRLPAETALAKEFGCGRSTIREALGQLAAAGLIESRRGSGAHVLDWRRHGTPALLPTYLPHAMIGGDAKPMLVELLWMRRLLAKEAVRLAAKYAKPTPLKEVRKLFERSGQEIDPQAHVTLELEVFRSLLQASELWPVVWFANSFWSPMLELHATFALALGGPPADYAQAMDRLLTLIEAHDEVGALTEVDRYLDRVDASLAAALAGEAAPADKADSTAKASTAETAGSAAKPSTAAKAPAPAKRAKSRAATV